MGSIGGSKPVSLHIWVTKKPEMSYKEFHDYWRKEHGRMFLEMDVVRKHCLRYEQVSIPHIVTHAIILPWLPITQRG